MKTPLTYIRPGAIIAGILLCTLSCSKVGSPTVSTQTNNELVAISLESSATTTQSFFNDAFDLVMQNGVGTTAPTSQSGHTTNSLETNTVSPDCTTITASSTDPTVFPKTITVNYGGGCVNNGITRQGKIIISLGGPVTTPGSVIGVTFQGYAVNGIGISGTYNITPVAGTGGGTNFTISVINGTITSTAGTTFTYNCSETFTQTAGMSTAAIADDTYSISGTFSYAGAGASLAATITTPLVRPNDCAYITSGVIGFTYNSITGTLDYGAGTCDASATLKAGATTETIATVSRLNP
jgi:hypothetical protein